MTANGWVQIVLFFGVVLALTVPTGAFLHKVMEGEVHALRRPLGWLERLVYRLGGVRLAEQAWPQYCASLLAFSALTMLVTYAIQRLQHCCRSTRSGWAAVAPDLAFNTAASFTTNTNWQGYVGRGDDELPHPDGGAGLAQLHLRGGRAWRWRWRSRAA